MNRLIIFFKPKNSETLENLNFSIKNYSLFEKSYLCSKKDYF